MTFLTSRPAIGGLLALTSLLALSPVLGAQHLGAQSIPDYKILNAHQILVQIPKSPNGITAPQIASAGGLTRVDPAAPCQGACKLQFGWYLLTFPGTVFQASQPFIISYSVDGNAAHISLSAASGAKATKNEFNGGSYVIVSNVAFGTLNQPDLISGRLAIEANAISVCQTGSPQCNSKEINHIGWVEVPVSAFPKTSDINKFQISNVLGGTGKASYTSPPVPTTKQASRFYANVNIAAATGSSFAWGLDGSTNFTHQLGLWQIGYLTATANGGHNVGNIQGQSYTDSVTWSLPFTFFIEGDDSFSKLLRGFRIYRIAALPKYETDFELDRKNFLGSFYPFFQIHYNTLEKRVADQGQANSTLTDYIKKNGFWNSKGDEFDVQPAVEGGAALSSSVQKPSQGKAAPVTIPTYSILRAAPQIHGLFEVGSVSVEDTFTGRYLGLTENSAVESKSHIVYPLRLSGWKAINKLVTSYKPNPAGNFAISATYTDGFDAPKFKHTNSVQAGFTLIF